MIDPEQGKTWFGEIATTYTSKQRKNWYSEVADAYNRVRPRYPKELICRAVELAQLPADATILELGCGPGIATVEFAQLGFSILCLEPSKELCQLAQQNCTQYSSVEITNTTFEEWKLDPKRFSAVVAATSIHWIPPEIRYSKAAAALQESSSLILLWNMTPQPNREVYQVLAPVYQTQAPSLAQFYEDKKTQEETVRKFGQAVIDSGKFKNLVSEQLACKLTYSIDDYLALLGTLSPYRRLNPNKRNSVFEGLREALDRNGIRSIETSYLSAFHVAQKI